MSKPLTEKMMEVEDVYLLKPSRMNPYCDAYATNEENMPFKKAQGSIETDTILSKTLHDGQWQLMIPELNNSRNSTQEVFKLPNKEWTSSVPVIESTTNTIYQELR